MLGPIESGCRHLCGQFVVVEKFPDSLGKAFYVAFGHQVAGLPVADGVSQSVGIARDDRGSHGVGFHHREAPALLFRGAHADPRLGEEDIALAV